MKAKTVVIIIAIMAVVGIAAFLLIRRKRQQEQQEYEGIEEKSVPSSSPAVAAPAAAPAPATTGGAYPNEVGGVKYATKYTARSGNKGLIGYLAVEGGKEYDIPTDKAKVRVIQQGLIDGFTDAAKASSTLKTKNAYLSLVDDMNKAGGVDGVFGKATARAFAYAAAKMPLIFKQYEK